jgi:putrescine aminotransferase
MPSIDDLQSLDRQFHLHPFTHHNEMHASGTNIIRGGKGCYLIDQHGRKLLDGLAGLWCVNVGYGRDEIADAVHNQMKEMAYYCSFFNSTTEPAIQLAAKLAEKSPKHLKHTIFSSSGSESNETAMKLARGYWKIRGKSNKHKFLSRTFSYHGVGMATTSLTGLHSCTAPFDLPLPGWIHVPGPYAYAANREGEPDAYASWCIDETERIIHREGAGTIAALFAEPIQGAGGVIVPPRGHLNALRELCRKHEILFIADEVITGFGRVGDWFASNLCKLDPDILTMAKGISSGYLPLGATMLSDEMTEVLNSGGLLAHGFTYSGHPSCCAAGLANIEIIEKEKLIERVRDEIGEYFQEKLNAYRGHPAVGETRGAGLLGAIELLPKNGKAGLTPSPGLGMKAASIARKHGVIVRGIRDLIALSPPLIVTRGEIDELFAAVGRTLDELWN